MLKLIKLNQKSKRFEMDATHIPMNKRKTVAMVANMNLIVYRL